MLNSQDPKHRPPRVPGYLRFVGRAGAGAAILCLDRLPCEPVMQTCFAVTAIMVCVALLDLFCVQPREDPIIGGCW